MDIFELTKDKETLGAARVMDRCDILATFSSMENAICRTYLTYQHKECNTQVSLWMKKAGMTSWIDTAGNCWGHYPAMTVDAPVVILGSHLDTVPNAGKYDGILGVLSAIEIIEKLHQRNIRLPFALEVVGFGDEEGSRFGATLLGSRAVAGQWDESWFSLKDENEIDLARAFSNFGLLSVDINKADRSRDNILAYLELHIEQGPVLEQKKQAVGVVTAIAGARRFKMNLKGMAGHAGTVPMEWRRDPLVAASACIQEIEKIANRMRILATVGKIECLPGSINVIPGRCEFTLDVRSGQDNSRDIGVGEIVKKLEDICNERQIQLSYEEIHNASAVQCTSWIQRMMEESILEQNLQPISLISGAGHDAMALDDITDIGMLFVRCAGGVSHNPAESVTAEDVNTALNVFYNMVLKIDSAEKIKTN